MQELSMLKCIIFIRENVLQGEIEMHHINTQDQVANVFTKRFNGNKLVHFRHQLGMKNLAQIDGCSELVLRGRNEDMVNT